MKSFSAAINLHALQPISFGSLGSSVWHNRLLIVQMIRLKSLVVTMVLSWGWLAAYVYTCEKEPKLCDT